MTHSAAAFDRSRAVGPAPPCRTAGSSAGFTLIELMAVVAMFALVAAMVAPIIDLGGARAVRREAEEIGAAIELARQRAIMTGREHDVVLDLESRQHWVEWAAPPDPELDPEGAAPAFGSPAPVAMTPPPSETEELVPVPGPFGRAHAMDDETLVYGVGLSDGTVDSGVVALRFGPDGSADPATIRVGDRERRHLLDVEVQALADTVRIVDVNL